MKVVPIALMLGLILLTSCTELKIEPQAYTARVADPAEVCFIIVAADTSLPVPGARVEIVEAETSRKLGISDTHGLSCIKKDDIRNSPGRVITFCHDAYFCGAFDTSVSFEKTEFLDLHEHLISLAPFLVN